MSGSKYHLMRILRRDARRKSFPIGVPPIESREGREKRSRMIGVWCLSSVRSGFSLVWGNPSR